MLYSKITPCLLVLNDCGIDSAGSSNLSIKCADVVELDLAQNRLTKWPEVLNILYSMPRLKFANLSFNNLSEKLEQNLTSNAFPDLSSLVSNKKKTVVHN